MTLIDKAEALALFAADENVPTQLVRDAIAALPARGVGVPTEEDREWIDARADELFRANERIRGSVRPSTIRPQDFRDYFVVNATLERFAALTPTDAAQAPAEDAHVKGETAGQMLERLGMDGAKWAAEFRTTALRLGYSDMDEGWLVGWFCNAIMAGHDRSAAQAREATEENKCGKP